MAGFFKTMIVLILTFSGAAYYETDGTFDLESDYVTLSSIDEVRNLILSEMNTEVLDRPDRISFEYITNGDKVDWTKDDILNVLYNGNYNVKSVKNFYIDVRGQVMNQLIENDRVVVHIHMKYIDTLNDERYIQSEIDRIMSTIIDHSMSDFQKIEAINQYITQYVEYNHSDRRNGQSVRVALEQGTGVCTANARLASRMLDVAGIHNIGVSGISDGNGDGHWIAHAWNKVYLDGSWYNLDTTWNTHRSVGDKHGEYLFFLVPDSYLINTHDSYSPLNNPDATNSQYQFLYYGDHS